MLELWELLQRLIHEPLRAGTLIALALFIIDRLFKQLFIRHVRKLLHIRDRNGVDLHMQRLNDIEDRLDLLMKERGIEWSKPNVHGLRNVSTDTAWRRNGSSWQWRKTSSVANIVRVITLFFGGLRMDKINKLLVLPLIAQICVILKDAFGITVGTEQQDAIATIVVLVVGLIGIWMNRHKKAKPDLENME